MKRFVLLLLVLVMTVSVGFAEQPVATPAPGTYEMTASGLVGFVRDQLGAGYIMGAYGHICTADFRNGRANIYTDSAPLIRAFGPKWDGGVVYDCIGLVKAFLIQGGKKTKDVSDVNVTKAWRSWTVETGPIEEGTTLQPGMLLFRAEGKRLALKHVGVYVGNGRVIHSRGTKWGVVEDEVPMVFTHWAKMKYIKYDLLMEEESYIDGPWLDVGELAVIDTDDEKPAPVINTPYGSGGQSRRVGTLPLGAVVEVIEVVDEMSRLVEGVDAEGRMIAGYVRLTSLSTFPSVELELVELELVELELVEVE